MNAMPACLPGLALALSTDQLVPQAEVYANARGSKFRPTASSVMSTRATNPVLRNVPLSKSETKYFVELLPG